MGQRVIRCFLQEFIVHKKDSQKPSALSRIFCRSGVRRRRSVSNARARIWAMSIVSANAQGKTAIYNNLNNGLGNIDLHNGKKWVMLLGLSKEGLHRNPNAACRDALL